MSYTDNTPMPFGKHKGTALANVPAHYLLWVYREGTSNNSLKQYIEDNMDAIKIEASQAQDRDRFNAR